MNIYSKTNTPVDIKGRQGPKALTVHTINERLAPRNIKLLGDHVITKNKAEFICSNYHRWWATINSVLHSGNGCPECAMVKRNASHRDELDLLLRNHKIVMLGEYLGNKNYTEFKCIRCARTWTGKPMVVKRSGCCFCNGRKTDKDIVNQRIKNTKIMLLTEMNNVGERGTFYCQHGHKWVTIISNVLHNKSGCPKCADYGFNPLLEAYCYVICYPDYIKFGITNDWERRKKEHVKTKGQFIKGFVKKVSTGDDALLWENTIKKTMHCGIVDSIKCRDGWTETISPELLHKIVDETFTQIYGDS
jgi:hypothetical protein